MKIKYILFFLCFSCEAWAQENILIAGSYTTSGSNGIYVFKFDDNTGSLNWICNTEKGSVINPSFLTVSENGIYIYACTDTRLPNEGSVSAYLFDKNLGKLTFLNKQPTYGDNPVYVSLNKSNKWLAAANYNSGNFTIFPINSDGSIGLGSQKILHSGNSLNKERQEKAHVHAVIFSPSMEHILVPDLGTDKVIVYPFEESALYPVLEKKAEIYNSTPGNGPRHLIFHPNSKFAYLIEELSGTVSVFLFANEKLNFIEQIETHTLETSAPYSAADIHISPDGRFLYTSNRGKENNITIFAIEAETGKLRHLGYQSTLGESPRNFVISPSGKYIIVANEISGTIRVFNRDIKTGLLHPSDVEIKVGGVSCLKML